MIVYRLLAHCKDGSRAIVQHGREPEAYEHEFNEIKTYVLVSSDSEFDRNEWIIDYHPKVNMFDTIFDLERYVKGAVA